MLVLLLSFPAGITDPTHFEFGNRMLSIKLHISQNITTLSRIAITAIACLTASACGTSDSEECSTDNVRSVVVWGFLDVSVLTKGIGDGYEIIENTDQYAFRWSDFYVSTVMGVTEAEDPRYTKNNILHMLFKNAEASCLTSYGISREGAETIDVTSNTDYSADFPAGASLGEVFGYFGIVNLLAPAGQVNHKQFNLEALPYLALPEYFAKDSFTAAPVNFILKPLIPVEQDSRHIFTITYTLSTGEVFSFNTEEIRLLPSAD